MAIRDLKAGAGLAHLPSGQFNANAAWLLAATLAHNLLRWTAAIGLGARNEQTVAKTIRRTLLMPPGLLTRSARRWRLHLPAGWPWAHTFQMALARLRCIPDPPDRPARPPLLLIGATPTLQLHGHPPKPAHRSHYPSTSRRGSATPSLHATTPSRRVTEASTIRLGENEIGGFRFQMRCGAGRHLAAVTAGTALPELSHHPEEVQHRSLRISCCADGPP